MDPTRASEVAELAAWITSGFERAKIECLQLGQRSATGETRPISVWMAYDFEGKDPEHLAYAIVSEASKDAATQRGTTRYVVQSFKKSERIHFARHSFRLPGGRDVEAEPGIGVRMMRHVVGIFGCAAEAVERASSWVASSARTFSEGGDARYQRGD